MSEFDTVINERGAEVWNNLPETLTTAGDFDGLHELLLVSRNQPDFPDLLRHTMIAMHKRGIESGRADIMKCVLADSADMTVQQWDD